MQFFLLLLLSDLYQTSWEYAADVYIYFKQEIQKIIFSSIFSNWRVPRLVNFNKAKNFTLEKNWTLPFWLFYLKYRSETGTLRNTPPFFFGSGHWKKNLIVQEAASHFLQPILASITFVYDALDRTNNETASQLMHQRREKVGFALAPSYSSMQSRMNDISFMDVTLTSTTSSVIGIYHSFYFAASCSICNTHRSWAAE